jgi:hypothetical protein
MDLFIWGHEYIIDYFTIMSLLIFFILLQFFLLDSVINTYSGSTLFLALQNINSCALFWRSLLNFAFHSYSGTDDTFFQQLLLW